MVHPSSCNTLPPERSTKQQAYTKNHIYQRCFHITTCYLSYHTDSRTNNKEDRNVAKLNKGSRGSKDAGSKESHARSAAKST
eukprot:1937805-Pleurochrysis_carterae.AAC.1